MNNGFIYPIFNGLVRGLFYLNLVEYFKIVAKWSAAKWMALDNQKIDSQSSIIISNIAIDIFLIFKWGVLLVFWMSELDSVISKWIIYYLVISNLFTYFYYHVWGSDYSQRVDRGTLNRKFLNAILAIFFYIACYSYLYQHHYWFSIKWPDNLIDATNAIYLSIANAFTLTYGGFSPLNQEIRIVFASQLINTFLFFTIIVANSIPNHDGNDTQ